MVAKDKVLSGFHCSQNASTVFLAIILIGWMIFLSCSGIPMTYDNVHGIFLLRTVELSIT